MQRRDDPYVEDLLPYGSPGFEHAAAAPDMLEYLDLLQHVDQLHPESLAHRSNEQLMNSMIHAPQGLYENETSQGEASLSIPQNSYYRRSYAATDPSYPVSSVIAPFYLTAEVRRLLDYWVTNRSYSVPEPQQWLALETIVPWHVASEYIDQRRLALGPQTEPEQPKDPRHDLPSSRSLRGKKPTRSRKEIGDSKVKYTCMEPGCEPRFVSENRVSFKRHLRGHTEPSEVFICMEPNCRFTHHRGDKYKEHIWGKHKRTESHPRKQPNPKRCSHKECPFDLCDETFNVPEEYYDHYIAHCDEEGGDSLGSNGGRDRDDRLDGDPDNISMGTYRAASTNRDSQRRAAADPNNQTRRKPRETKRTKTQSETIYSSSKPSMLPDGKRRSTGMHRNTTRHHPVTEPAAPSGPASNAFWSNNHSHSNDPVSPANSSWTRNRQRRVSNDTRHAGSWVPLKP